MNIQEKSDSKFDYYLSSLKFNFFVHLAHLFG